ncbi:MAG: hypothetical protein JO041_07695 [Acidobacteria bacterium]|nr:hypothetical protein [Acidobacteriota bacterium]
MSHITVAGSAGLGADIMRFIAGLCTEGGSGNACREKRQQERSARQN